LHQKPTRQQQQTTISHEKEDIQGNIQRLFDGLVQDCRYTAGDDICGGKRTISFEYIDGLILAASVFSLSETQRTISPTAELNGKWVLVGATTCNNFHHRALWIEEDGWRIYDGLKSPEKRVQNLKEDVLLDWVFYRKEEQQGKDKDKDKDKDNEDYHNDMEEEEKEKGKGSTGIKEKIRNKDRTKGGKHRKGEHKEEDKDKIKGRSAEEEMSKGKEKEREKEDTPERFAFTRQRRIKRRVEWPLLDPQDDKDSEGELPPLHEILMKRK